MPGFCVGGLVCTGVAQPKLAVPFWERILTMEEDPYARIGLAKHALETGAVHDADQHPQLLAHEPSHGEAWLLRGDCCDATTGLCGSGTGFDQAKRLGADRRKALMGMVMAEMGDNRAEAAWSHVADLCADHPDDEECMQWMLKCGTMLQRWDALASSLATFLLPAIQAISLCDLPWPE